MKPADEWKTDTGQFVQWGRFDISAGSPSPSSDSHYRIGSVSNVNDTAQNIANARLIATAPELLRVLQLIDKRLRDCDMAGISATDAYDSFYREEVEAVLALATPAPSTQEGQ
jgi:hypothetical protein